MSRPLLVLRPEPGTAATVARAKDMGLDARAMPLFAVEHAAWDAGPASTYDGVLLTSANAVRHAGLRLAGYSALPAYTVGAATAGAAREAGFSNIFAGSKDVAHLIAQITAKRLLHLSGEDVTAFEAPNVEIDRHIVYRAVEAAPPAAFAAVLMDAPVVLIHSQRAGARLSSLVESRSHIALVAISAAAAAQTGSGWQKLAVAPEPRDEAMLEIAARLCRA